MKVSQQQITDAQKVYNLFWDSYLAGDVDTFASTLDDKFEMIGTSESERCHTKEDGIEFFKGQVEELVGKAEMRNRQINAMPVEGMVLINELCDIYVLAETDWNFYSIIRISTFLRETPDGWKVAQQHGSLPDNRVQEGETLAIDKISRENIELRDAVKRRTAELENKNRELEIEAALERVRARAMSMHKSDELNEVVSVLFEKLKELQIPFTAVGIATRIEGSKDLNAFVCGQNDAGLVITNYRLPYFDNPIPKDLYSALEMQLDPFVGHYSKEEKDSFYEYVLEHTAEFRHLPEDIKRMIFESPAYTITHVAAKNAVFNINDFEGKELAEHEVDIIKRFARVFDQAYTRFLDLQKAEEQVREAEIQLALERVRAKTMAMKTQSDLLDIIELFGEQLNAVGIRFDNVTFIEGPITKKRDWDLWSYAPEAENTTDKILIPYIETPYFTKTAKAVKEYQKTGQPIQVKTFTKKEKNEFLDHYWKHAPAVSDEFVNYVNGTPGSIIVDAFLEEITVSMVKWNAEPYTVEELEIFERFAKEFRQTYIRFLDIKKAEAQAREAQIEAALEKVRSRSMAMHNSQELKEVALELRKQMGLLGQKDLEVCAIHLYGNDEDSFESWSAMKASGSETEIVQTQAHFPKRGIRIVDEMMHHYTIGTKDYVLVNEGEKIAEWFKVLKKHAPELHASILDSIGKVPVKQLKANWAVADFSGGALVMVTYGEPDEVSRNLLRRSSNVFEQAYVRFLDLQKAEVQARESQIQLALERVRARTMAMQKSEELADASQLLDEQVRALGIETWGCAFHIYANNEEGDFEWFSGSNGSLPFYKTPREDFFLEFYKMGQKGEKFHIKEFKDEACKTHYDFLKTIPVAGDALKALEESGVSLPSYQIDHIAFFKHGYVLFITYEAVPEAHEVFQRFAKVFEQTYTRFLDLKKAEEQAREAQINLAVERVRARALAMFKSEEILEVVHKLKEEIMGLDIPNVTAATIHLKEPDGKYRAWDLTSISEDENELEISLDIRWHREDTHPDFFMREVWDRTEDYFVVIQGEDRYTHTVQWLHQNGHSDYAEEFEKFLESSQLEKAYHPTVPLNNGRMCIDLLDPPAPEIESILKKMAGAFDLAYKRFEDLQKAEAQTREAKIETALEKVRSRTMGMQRSDELAEVANVLFTEMNDLVHNLWTCGFVLCEKGREEDEWWLSLEDGFSRGFFLPNINDYAHATLYEGWLEGDSFRTAQLDGDKLQEHYDWLMQIPVAKNIFDDMEAAGMQRPEWQKLHAAYFSKGYLVIITREPCPEEEVFKRFAKVFDQTYTRFLDLKKAEAQARESQIETALEKVRSRTMAMQHSDELIETSELMFEQIKNLDIELWSCGFSLWYDDDSYFMGYNTGPDGKMGDPLKIPLTEDVFFTTIRDAKRRGDDFLVFESEGESLAQTYRYMDTLPVVGEFMRGIVAAGAELPKYQVTHCGFFSHGHLMFIALEHNPEAIDIFKRFTKVFEQTYTRFLDLQKAEEQARKAQIEASLERVRAKAMSMQNSDELDEVLSVLCEQFDVLGILPMSTHMTVFNFDNNTFTFRETGKYGDRSFGEQTVDLDAMDTWKETVDKWKADKATAVNKLHFPKETLPEVWEVFHESFASMPEKSRITPDDYPDGIYHTAGKHPFGYIGMNQIRPATGEEEEIVIKFANEFGRAYQRFLDLQKAEEQAREARIETALEKIRSRTMAMQKGEELQEVAVLLYKELIALGVTNFVTCGYVEVNEDIRRQHTWVTAPGGDTMGLFHLPLTGDDTFDARYAAWKKQQPVFHQSVAGQVRSDHLEYAITTFNSKEAEEMVRSQFPDPTVFYCFNFSHGYLHIVGGSLLEKEEENLLARFTKVFEQTYTRFLDLQKAEEQAREAKIEMSLEKIRSRTMGMQSSDELPEVANMLFLEVQELGIPAWSCGYCILTEDRRASTCIMSSEGTVQKPFLLPHTGEASFQEWDDFVHSDEIFFTQELGGEAINSHYNFMKSLPQLKPVFQDLVDAGLSLPAYQINHLCKFSHGFLLFITYEEVPGSHDIFKRFTSVFDQTYTRFLDLKKSEQRAREAEVDLSLERVRSQVTAMQTSSDLFDIVVNMRKEFVSLGHTADYFWHMSWLPDSYEMSMTSEDGNRIGMVISLPRFVHEQIPGLAEWEKGSEPTYVLALNAEEAWDYIENMNTHGHYEQVDPHAPTRDDIKSIGGLTFIIARTSHGEIGFSLPGEVPHPPQEALDTLVRFAGVFDLAYQRFEDLQESEQQARLILEERDRLEIALKELHATQDQLVQQEKLASLGQLTAGIAHEIKNPLNFVNNFSEVSIELVQEAREEVLSEKAKGKSEKGKSPFEGGKDGEAGQGDDTESGNDSNLSLILEILDDIEVNLRKIHEHGSRADGIVKSMLQHSRGGDGKMEPSPLNPLFKEYVNLAFHGMRAGKEPINVDIDLQLDESVGEVPLIAEDFSRVILNLCNNAFDAMREKINSELNIQNSKFSPKLTVRTKLVDEKVVIEVQDNGPGIPDAIKDKILQPFFTTKKGTQGTGLGLSITNDIVKAHGGVLNISTQAGKRTTFTIELPKSGL